VKQLRIAQRVHDAERVVIIHASHANITRLQRIKPCAVSEPIGLAREDSRDEDIEEADHKNSRY
jgi:hypothetical protein